MGSSNNAGLGGHTHPECRMFFLDLANPYRTLEIRAHAEIHVEANI